MKSTTTSLPSFPLLFLLLILFLSVAPNSKIFRFAEASKRRIHITDDLDDVVDDEEDEAWKQWGKKSTPTSHLDPSDFSKMDPSQIQAEMMKQQSGPVIGFVKLRLGVRRTPDMVADIAMKWTKITRNGAVGVRFMGIDTSTIMFNLERGSDIEELREFILDQPEAYEIKIADQIFRRPGDPPLDEVVAKINSEKNKADNVGSKENYEHLKVEL